jgi:uncharacterized membrane protein
MTSASKTHFLAAWGLFKQHWGAFLLAQLAIVSAWLVLEIAVVTAHWSGMPSVAYWPVWLSLHLAFLWVFCGLVVGMYFMALQAVDGEVPTFATAVSRLDRGKTYLLASLLYWAAVVGGLCLAVIPGIIAAVKWSPYRFVLAGDSHSGLSALHEAALLTTKRRWQLFRVLAVSAALNLAGAALLGIGLLVAFPVGLMLRASYFRALQQQMAALPSNDDLFPVALKT